MKKISIIATQQMQEMLRQPLVLCITGLIVFIVVLNAAANSRMIPEIDLHVDDGNDHFFSVGISNPFFETSILLSILSMFIGALTIAEERASGSLRLLITKPVYRRDIFIGKFIGLSVLLLFLTTAVIMLTISTLIVFYRAPLSGEDLLLRMLSYISVLFLSCELTLGISMLISIIGKNLLAILIYTGTFLCVDWYFSFPEALQSFGKILVPTQLYFSILSGANHGSLFETSNSLQQWFGSSVLYIVILVFEVFVVILLSNILFMTDEV